MGLRLIETRLPAARGDEVDQTLAELSSVATWCLNPEYDLQIWHILAFSDDVETIVDAFEEKFSDGEDFRLVIYDIEATVPRAERGEDDKEDEELSPESKRRPRASINIEELYEDIVHGVRLSWDYAMMVAMSAIVAAVGIYRDDLILVIAAMIIAPLLHSNMALSLATTLADRKLGWHAIKINTLNLIINLKISLLFGLLLPLEPDPDNTTLRTTIGALDVVVAAAAGTAGALSFVSLKPGTVVGVMIAVALLPPLVSLGMLAGAGYWAMAVAPALLLTINIICINLAGVLTFISHRIHPRVRWKEERAEHASRRAVALWMGLLALLVGIAVFAGEYWQAFW